MAVVINGRSLRQPVTGVQRYARALVARLGDRADIITPNRAVSGWRGHLWEQTVLPTLAGERLVWGPANTGPVFRSHQVVTIHDAAVLDRPAWFNPSFARWYRIVVPRLVQRVRRVIAPSAFSKARLVEHTGVEENRITVIPNGVDERFRSAAPEDVAALTHRLRLDRGYVLTVGSIEPRKNLPRLIRAWSRISTHYPDLQLVVAGGSGDVFGRLSLGTRPDSVRLLGYVPDEDLPTLMSGAMAFAYVSLYEGFGLPILEAMACGTPVVTSDVASMPEVAGNAAVLVDPTEVDAIATGLASVLDDAQLRRSLSDAGSMRACEFRWERTAERTWRTLLSAAG